MASPTTPTGDQLDNPAFFETVQVNEVSTGGEMSRATSFNMISKHGSNDWHASAYYKHENSGLNATETFNRASGLKKAPYILHEADADVSGPIIKNRTWFYGAWIRQLDPAGLFYPAHHAEPADAQWGFQPVLHCDQGPVQQPHALPE